jgi:hypothetical protein
VPADVLTSELNAVSPQRMRNSPPAVGWHSNPAGRSTSAMRSRWKAGQSCLSTVRTRYSRIRAVCPIRGSDTGVGHEPPCSEIELRHSILQCLERWTDAPFLAVGL